MSEKRDKSIKKIIFKETNITPKGHLNIYDLDKEGNKKLISKDNVVVLTGREWAAQRLFAFNNPYLRDTDSKADEWINWLSVGNGGCTPSDPLIPLVPLPTDRDLNEPIIISNDEYAPYGDWYFSATEAGWRKKNTGQVDFEQDGNNFNYFLIVRIETILDVGEGDNKLINEAGMYTAASIEPNYNGPFHLFSKATFSTIPKTPERRLLFSWNIYL